MGPLGTGRYASGAPSARVEGALADGTDLLLRSAAALSSRAATDPRGARLAPTRAGQPPDAPHRS